MGAWVKEQAERELAEFYPKDTDGGTPIAYLWARTIRCEGPTCGSEVPLIRSLWLAQKAGRSDVLRLILNSDQLCVDFEIIQGAKAKDVAKGTVQRGSATCPVCGFTTPVASVRRQLKDRRGGAHDARMFCVVTTRPGQQGRSFRLPIDRDIEAVSRATFALDQSKQKHQGTLSLVPHEPLDVRGIRYTCSVIYGRDRWEDYFTPRQALSLGVLTKLVVDAGRLIERESEKDFSKAVRTVLALAVDRIADICNCLCTWKPSMTQAMHLFARQAIPITWDFAETSPLSDAAGDFTVTISNMIRVLEQVANLKTTGQAMLGSATRHPLPDGSADAIVTDPPYYDAVPYSYLSDFFYVWLRRSLSDAHPELFKWEQVPKDKEIVVDRPHELSDSEKDIAFYERELKRAFAEGRCILRSGAISTIVFASKTMESWEAILQAVVESGWVVTGSWPIHTEMETRVAAQGQARLASSAHLVCRPRESLGGSLRLEDFGDWRDVLEELPRRIHQWLPRLANEGVVGADALFACLGPALEIFSRYARVEKANGNPVSLREYLEQVWAAVFKV